ncbi:AmmeMemoRadiSam system radical SAM enzyme [Coprothermobacter platensis]|uniref:AmmeMemoRadiSam system radical SAM enzyme n=1 Tax=Coprothermobacter platensis TaxID=108819 RepID=UPI000374690B|nr:AmmeMemoRadiSam system radical SAM enzyme [Coprothermobacter platensis]
MKLFANSKQGTFCLACPRACNLSRVKAYCGVRSAHGENVTCDVYGLVSSLAIDPVEKKPVFHYMPSSDVLSVGTLGCNMRCKGCQNWEIAHRDLDTYHWQLKKIMPDALSDLALAHAQGVAWTYNEPTVWAEYVHDSAELCKAKGLFTIVVTNGYYSVQTFALWEPVIDVFRIDIKGYSDSTYDKFAPGVKASVVLENVERAISHGKHVEVVTNVMPGINDSDLPDIASFLVHLSPDIPWHITRFFPDFELSELKPTPIKTLTDARAMAMDKGLHYVYVGNVDMAEVENTVCPSCGKLLIERKGLLVTHNFIVNDRCPNCGQKIYGRFGG